MHRTFLRRHSEQLFVPKRIRFGFPPGLFIVLDGVLVFGQSH